jgi:shikimate kinase
MKSLEKIFLIGMPGSGKSTIAGVLAEKLAIAFIDLDIVIEIMHGKSITEIFKEVGEEEFRKIESNVLISLIASSESFILATGGGTPCFFNHMQRMKDSGVTIYLNTPVDILIKRTTENKERPLLMDKPEEKLMTLLDNRANYYEQAKHVVNTANKTIDEVVREVVELLS